MGDSVVEKAGPKVGMDPNGLQCYVGLTLCQFLTIRILVFHLSTGFLLLSQKPIYSYLARKFVIHTNENLDYLKIPN